MGIPRRLAKLRRKRTYGSIPLDEVVAVGEAWAKLDMLEARETAYEIAYAYEALNKLKDMVDRGPKAALERHLIPKVPHPVDRYMSEATSCYRYGFDLACVSLCRSALEEALKDSLKRALDLTREQIKQYTLRQLIDLATRCRILDQDQRHDRMAHQITNLGNDFVHGDLKEMDVRPTALDVLFDIRLIIRHVYSGDS